MTTRDAREPRLFRDHPDREVTLPWGTVVRVPFHAYAAETAVVGGTVKLEALARSLVPEGLVPIRLRDAEGPHLGAAWLWWIDYQSSNHGAFTQMAVGFAAAHDTMDVPLRNAASPLAALAHPGGCAFLRTLFTSAPEVVRVGREVWGFPSERAEVTWAHPPGRLHCEVRDAEGHEVVTLDVRDRGGALRRLVGGLRAGRAMGWEQAATMLLSPSLPLTLVTPRAVKCSRTPLRLHGAPVLYRWKPTDILSLGTRSACGAALADLGFSPTVVVRHPALRFVILPDPDSMRRVPTDRIRYEDDL